MDIVHTDLPDRFWSKVDKTDDCWLWIAGRSDKGYGKYRHEGLSEYAHRVAYVDRNGPIPDGLELDHLCRVPLCVNPAHLEAVTRKVNVNRGLVPLLAPALARETNRKLRARTHCRRGHEYTPANTTVGENGWRRCVTCQRKVWREFAQRKRESLRNEG